MKKTGLLIHVLSVLIFGISLFAVAGACPAADSGEGPGRTFSINPPAEITACIGDTITVPIILSQPDFPIAAFLLSMTYPRDLLDYLAIDVSGTLMENWAMIGANEPEPGLVRVAGITMEATITGGTFFKAAFRVEAGIPGQGSICLSDFTDDLATAQTSCGTVTTRDCSATPVEDDDPTGSALPGTFALLQNYPNPFNPTTTISYTLPVQSTKSKVEGEGSLNFEPYTLYVTLKVFNVMGQEMATLVDEVQGPGAYSLIWDAFRVPSGVYFCQLAAGELSETRSMLLVK